MLQSIFTVFYCNILIMIDFPWIALHSYHQNNVAKYCVHVDFPLHLFNFEHSGKPSVSQMQNQTYRLEIHWREESALSDCIGNFLFRGLHWGLIWQAEKGAQPNVIELDCPLEDGRSFVLAEQKLPTLLHDTSFLDIRSFLIASHYSQDCCFVFILKCFLMEKINNMKYSCGFVFHEH